MKYPDHLRAVAHNAWRRTQLNGYILMVNLTTTLTCTPACVYGLKVLGSNPKIDIPPVVITDILTPTCVPNID